MLEWTVGGLAPKEPVNKDIRWSGLLTWRTIRTISTSRDNATDVPVRHIRSRRRWLVAAIAWASSPWLRAKWALPCTRSGIDSRKKERVRPPRLQESVGNCRRDPVGGRLDPSGSGDLPYHHAGTGSRRV